MGGFNGGRDGKDGESEEVSASLLAGHMEHVKGSSPLGEILKA